ncbi:Maf family protein [Candidatus Saccharibacteria bacterium]|nr:Maf family protein [Candidatus Saccharibacteria bacterium]
MLEAQNAQVPYERKPGKIHSFFALKFHEGDEDRAKVEAIEAALNKAGIEITLMARDVEKWGEAEIPEGKTLMRDYAFPAMQKCDCNIIEFSEKGVGLGMNAGYCFAIGKPIYIIAKTGSDISTTIANVASEVIFYDNPDDLVEPFTRIVKKFPRVILASSSVYRKQQMIDAEIPFEAIVSNADETPDTSKSFEGQLAEIAMRKATAVLNATRERGPRLILAADQNTVFDGKMYGKPKSVEAARELIAKMRGRDDIYEYTGNAFLLVDGDKILESINITDISRLAIDDISDDELDAYIADGHCMSCCGSLVVDNNPFVHIVEGRKSAAKGITLEYANELLKRLMNQK